MRTHLTSVLCVLSVLSSTAIVAVIGCSETTNNTHLGGNGGASEGGSGGSGNGSAQGGDGGGGDGGGVISGTGGNDGGLEPDTGWCMQSSPAMLTKKPVDIIFVVDNSSSMGQEILQVQANINQNFANILLNSGLKYRLIMVSRHGSVAGSQSICVEAPLSGIPAGGCDAPPPEPIDNPPTFYHYNVEIGKLNSLCTLIDGFTTPDLNGKAPMGYQEWLRPEAQKVFIEITDGRVSCTTASTGVNLNDLNTGMGGIATADQFDAELLKLSPTQFGTKDVRNYAFYSIVGMELNNPPFTPYEPIDPMIVTPCPGITNAGTGYQGLSILTNAQRFSLCDTSIYDVIFQEIAKEVISDSKLLCDFAIPDPPMGQTIEIKTLQLLYKPAGTGTSMALKKVADAASCAPDSFYVDEVAKRVYLCPDMCTVVQNDNSPNIDVLVNLVCAVGG